LLLSASTFCSMLYLREGLMLDYLCAGLCLLGAVFCIFPARIFAG